MFLVEEIIMEKPKTSVADVLMYVILASLGLADELIEKMKHLTCVARHGRHDWNVSTSGRQTRCSRCNIYNEM